MKQIIIGALGVILGALTLAGIWVILLAISIKETHYDR